MSNCSLCSTELKFMNTMKFGSGKLIDGSVLCTICFKKVNNANPSIAFKLKKHSLTDIQNLCNCSGTLFLIESAPNKNC